MNAHGLVERRTDGFTLLELLVVVGILAVIAGGVIAAIGSAKEDASLQVAQSEILTIKQALLQFKQDTGFFPKQGPFELAPPHTPCVAANPNGEAPLPPGTTRDWYCSPANFYQLYDNPLAGTGHPLETWNPDTGRGWRGPYLTRHGEGLVDVGDGLQPDGSGDPTQVVASALINVRGVADPFVAWPVMPGSYARCLNPSEATCLLDWRSAPAPPDETHPRWGRPHFLFNLDNDNAQVVSMGPNRRYDGGIGDDVVLDLLK